MDALLEAVANLSQYHREHEKYYSQAPLETALSLQRVSRTFMALAERWSHVQPEEHPVRVPFAGAPDLNDDRATELSGVLFMEGDDAPDEIGRMIAELQQHAAAGHQTEEWLSSAMETAWRMAEALLGYAELADLLGERHRIISNDWLNASLAGLIARHLDRAATLLGRVDFSPAAVRADLADGRVSVRYLQSACELIDRAADLAAESSVLVHENERRWRVFRKRVENLTRP
jgi:hypothetical protein